MYIVFILPQISSSSITLFNIYIYCRCIKTRKACVCFSLTLMAFYPPISETSAKSVELILCYQNTKDPVSLQFYLHSKDRNQRLKGGQLLLIYSHIINIDIHLSVFVFSLESHCHRPIVNKTIMS